MAKFTLYGYFICPFVQRVRFALEEAKIDYDYIEIDLNASEQKTEEYKKITPFQKVPSLAYNGTVLFESLALLDLLSDLNVKIFPADPVAKTQQRIWAAYFDQNIIGKFFGVIPHLKSKDEAALKKNLGEFFENLRFFTIHSGLQKTIEANPKAFFSGDEKNLTFVDFAVSPFLRLFDLVVKTGINKSVYDYAPADDDKVLHAVKTYANNLFAAQAFKDITTEFKVLPPAEKNSLLKELGVDSKAKFNYDEIVKAYTTKRHFS